MSHQEQSSNEGPESGDDRVPVMQEIYDNIWFLFLISGVMVLVSYIIWGLIDLLSTPTLP